MKTSLEVLPFAVSLRVDRQQAKRAATDCNAPRSEPSHRDGTQRGRVATSLAYKHFGIEEPRRQPGLFS